MEINLEEIVPKRTKLSTSYQIFLPIEMRDFFGWDGGQLLEIYPTRRGIFITERSEKNKCLEKIKLLKNSQKQ